MPREVDSTHSSGRIEVRGVNGDGPRCGCGEPSSLHVIAGAARDYFLCRECSLRAVEAFFLSTEQDAYGRCARPEHDAGDCEYCAEGL